MEDSQKKLELLEDKLVEQIVFDVLHMKFAKAYERVGVTINIEVDKMQHIDYKSIVAELKKRYRNQINKINQQSTTI